MLRFYMDEGVQGPITRGARARGLDVLTVQEDGREAAGDPNILDRAGELERLLFSQDDDLLAEATRCQRAGHAFAGVVYAHQRVPVGRCVEYLELIAATGFDEEFASRVFFIQG